MAGKGRRSGKPTLADVASAAEVGSITVSRVLRNPGWVSKHLKERVLEAVRDIGHDPNCAALALASSRINVIGAVVPSMTKSVFNDVLRGIYDGIGGSACQVQFGVGNSSSLKENALFRLFQGQRPAAMLVTGLDQSQDARRALKSLDCPVVQIMELGADPAAMLVGFAHQDACEAVTRHLIDQGYRRIGFLAAQMDTRTRLRLDGHARAMRGAGLLDDRLVITTPKPTSILRGGELLSELLSRIPDADAAQTNNDDIAMSVVPSLTSVRTCRYEMGKLAIDMLIAAIEGRRPEAPAVDLGFKLIARQSTDRTRRA